jgi:hypothetical protein
VANGPRNSGTTHGRHGRWTMDATFAIDYNHGLATLEGQPYAAIVAAMRGELPHVWRARYERMCVGPANVLVVTATGFEYLFDFCSELVAHGTLAAGREDRVVAAYGRSTHAIGARPSSRLAGFPGSDGRGDRGHFIAHAAGGGADINLFHQEAFLNRGWSPEGQGYRAMERYVARYPGLFCFSRPIYTDESARPSHIEFGVLRSERTLWVEVFTNEPL